MENQNKLTPQEIEQKIKYIICNKLGAEEGEVNNSTDIMNDIGADSLDMVEISMEIEKEIGVTIPDEKMEVLKTVGSLISYTQELYAEINNN